VKNWGKIGRKKDEKRVEWGKRREK